MKKKKKLRLKRKQKDERQNRINNISLYKYVGETSRSLYERAWEHENDKKQLKPQSHLLKHIVDIHGDQEIDDIKFGIRVLKFTKSSFERQVLESVLIQQERVKHHLLNSRSEFNRCAVPRLSTKIGDSNFKKYEKDLEAEKEKSEELEEKIRRLRKDRNLERRNMPGQMYQPPGKKRRLDEENHIARFEKRGKPGTREEGEKRKEVEDKEIDNMNPRKRFKQLDIREALEKQTRSETRPSPTPHPPPPSPQSPRRDPEEASTPPKYPEEFKHLTWDDKIEEFKLKIEHGEIEKAKRLERAGMELKSWELARICKLFLSEHADGWKKDTKQREKERQENLERNERIAKGIKKKETLLKKLKQTKLTNLIESLPKKIQN